MQTATHNIFVKVYHTLSELDVLLAIFCELAKRDSFRVTIFISNPNIYKQFLKNSFLRFAVSKLDIRIFGPLPFALEGEKPPKNRYVARLLYRLHSLFYSVCLLPFELVWLLKSSVYMHEITKFSSETWMMYLIKKILPSKQIFAYPHATAFNFSNSYKIKPRKVDATLLVFDERTKQNYRQFGYKDYRIIGYPKFFESWISLIRDFDCKLYSEPYCLIFSRPLHRFYMDENIYVWLYESSYAVIRELFGNIKIVVKTHPRENRALIETIIQNNSMQNIEFSDEYAPVLSKNALFALSFYTSAVLDSISMGIPSVEYYKEAKRFRESETEGSMYKSMGVLSCDDEDGLREALSLILKGSYKKPRFLEEPEFSFVDLGFLK